jgi:hypothetical protein
MGHEAVGRGRRIGQVGKRAAAASLALTATAAAGLTGTGIAAASTLAGSALGGTEQFQTMVDSPTATTVRVVEWGAIGTAAGVGYPKPSAKLSRFVFPDGSYQVTHSVPTGPHSLNPKTCLLRANEHGTYTVSGGTGKYKGITGSGKFTVSGIVILARTKSGACDTSANPVALQQVVDGTATVHIP